MIKHIFTAAIASLLLVSCTDHKAEQKKIMDNIMSTHERVMGDDEKLLDNKMLIDSLLKANKFDPKDSATVKADMRAQSHALGMADGAMEDWMHNFDPHKKGISDADQLKYLQDQNKEINRIDTLITKTIRASNAVIKSNGKK